MDKFTNRALSDMPRKAPSIDPYLSFGRGGAYRIVLGVYELY